MITNYDIFKIIDPVDQLSIISDSTETLLQLFYTTVEFSDIPDCRDTTNFPLNVPQCYEEVSQEDEMSRI